MAFTRSAEETDVLETQVIPGLATSGKSKQKVVAVKGGDILTD